MPLTGVGLFAVVPAGKVTAELALKVTACVVPIVIAAVLFVCIWSEPVPSEFILIPALPDIDPLSELIMSAIVMLYIAQMM
jgi:hypothetical protein